MPKGSGGKGKLGRGGGGGWGEWYFLGHGLQRASGFSGGKNQEVFFLARRKKKMRENTFEKGDGKRVAGRGRIDVTKSQEGGRN